MAPDVKSSFAMVLHCHIPYVMGHGQWPHGMDWLYEAAAETYVPLLNVFNDLADASVKYSLTIDISPVLAEQLADVRFTHGFVDYLDIKIKASRDNIGEFERIGDKHKKILAERWLAYYETIRNDFIAKYKSDIPAAFADLEDRDFLEIMTCGATHGYFPLLHTDESIFAQVETAVESHRRIFGKKPRGIWLPECAYRPRYDWKSYLDDNAKPYTRRGVEEFLYDNDIKYFVIDGHLLKGGKAIGTYLSRFEALQRLWEQFSDSYHEEEKDKSPFSTYWVGNDTNDKMAAVFTRNDKTSLQVWSGEYGYPGNSEYLDFHKKHFPGGNRYWAVTGAQCDLADKQEYYPELIEDAVSEQAKHFVNLVRSELEGAGGGVLTAPFDCELFGHWWFEGPLWLKKVFEGLSLMDDVETVTLGEYFEQNPPESLVSLPEGSWGEGGFHYIWLNDWTKWTWNHVRDGEQKMTELAGKHRETKNQFLVDILNQMARELLLLQSSDWQFLISTWSARDYAEQRVAVHNNNFKMLEQMASKVSSDKDLTEEERNLFKIITETDLIFPDVDFRHWGSLGEA